MFAAIYELGVASTVVSKITELGLGLAPCCLGGLAVVPPVDAHDGDPGGEEATVSLVNLLAPNPFPLRLHTHTQSLTGSHGNGSYR